jgi:hypothetical protein
MLSSVRTFSVAFVAAVATTGFGGTARAALDCPPSQPVVIMDVRAAVPTIDNTLPQSSLQQLAGVAYHRGRAEGLYKAQIGARPGVLVMRRGKGGETCLWIDKVTVTITWPMRKIYIVRNLPPGSCNYEAVLGHERKHQATDDAVLSEYVPRFRTQLEATIRALPPPRPVPLAQADAEENRLVGMITTTLERTVNTMRDVRHVRQAFVDTPDEYRRVGAACR